MTAGTMTTGRGWRSLLAMAAAAGAIASPTPTVAFSPSPSLAAPRAAQQDTTPKKDLPLEPGRTLDLRTSEGSWISLDVSPDGRTLVFDLLGDLYLLPIEGGTARQLTSGLGYDVQPRFSPDGRKVVFVSDRSGGDNVWIISVDGRDTTQVTKGNDNLYLSPEWTPDGDYVVASKSAGLGGPSKPWLYHVRGGTGVQLVKQPEQLKLTGAAFGPDDRWIWFAQRQGDWQYNAIFPQYQLTVYDRETGELTTQSARYGSGFRPALSPDGDWLTYGTRHEDQTGLVLRDLRTGAERWLAYPIQRDDQESRASLDVLPGYAFTPDGEAVVLSYGGQIWRVPVDGSAPSRIPFTVDTQLALGPEVDFAYDIDVDREFTLHQIRDAVPSPDGRRIAFTALDQLYVMDWPDGQPRRIAGDVPGGKFYPAWSPDGRSLAFVTWEDVDGGFLWRIGADGSAARRLSDLPGFYQETAWSPAGDRIVAFRAPARLLQEGIATGGFFGTPGAEFVWVPAEGGEVNVIAPAGDRGSPHFAGDADRIFAYSGEQGLVSFRWDGTDVRRHLKVTGATLPGAEQPIQAGLILMSPDQDRALAQIGTNFYLVTVPVVGGETPTVSVASPDNAAFPVTRLTDVGGQFPAWGPRGESVHWSIGNAHVEWDIAAAEAFADSVEAAADEPRDTTAQAAATPPRYRPLERRIAIRAQRDLPQGVAVLRGARVVTMRGDEVIQNGDVVVRDNRIEAVGATGQVAVPQGARVIDVAGKTIVPGFVDTHYHAQWLIPNIHVTDVWQYPANLAYGVTTTRDPQTATTDILTYGDRVETGELLGPRIFSTGPGVFIAENITSQAEARDVLRRYAEYYDTKTFKMYMSGNRQQRQWLIIAARELELSPTVEGGLDFKLNMTHAIDGYAGLEHSLPIYPIYDDVVDLFAETGITYSPTLLVSYGGPFGEDWFYATEDVHGDEKLRYFTPHTEIDRKARRRGAGAGPGPAGWAMREEYVFDDHAVFANDLVDAGGMVGVGSHGQLQGLGYHWELWAVQSGGMTEHEALRAATLMGAEAIGFDGDIGSIEPGKLADLVVLDRNPLDDIRNTNTIRYVMKNGRLYEGATLAEIHPRQRPYERRWFRAEEPTTAAGIR